MHAKLNENTFIFGLDTTRLDLDHMAPVAIDNKKSTISFDCKTGKICLLAPIDKPARLRCVRLNQNN